MWYIIGAVAVALILFLAVILVRAAMFKPREQEKPSKMCIRDRDTGNVSS